MEGRKKVKEQQGVKKGVNVSRLGGVKKGKKVVTNYKEGMFHRLKQFKNYKSSYFHSERELHSNHIQ